VDIYRARAVEFYRHCFGFIIRMQGVGGDGIVVCGSKAAHFTSPPSAMSFAAGKQSERSFHLNDDDVITPARIFRKFLIFIVVASFRAAERRRRAVCKKLKKDIFSRSATPGEFN
jgi:hypothetical protein